MSLSWRHGPIIAGVVAVGLAGAVILAKGNAPRSGTYQAAVDASDDLFGGAPTSAADGSASGGNTAPANVAPAPTNAASSAETPLTEEPSEPAVSPIATFVCKNRNGDARRPIQCDGRKTAHTWLTVPLKKKLLTSAVVTLEEYQDEARFLVGSAPARETGRYIRLASDIDVRAAKGAILRITYTPAELKAWSIAAKKLAIAAYDESTNRWIVLPSAVNQRARFVQASFATKRLPDQLFALVTKP